MATNGQDSSMICSSEVIFQAKDDIETQSVYPFGSTSTAEFRFNAHYVDDVQGFTYDLTSTHVLFL